MKPTLLTLMLILIAACANPSPACPPEQTECDGSCVLLQSDPMNCGSCGAGCAGSASCLAGKCSAVTCTDPDVYAACWVGGGVVGICSDTGVQTATAVVEPPAGDGGSPVLAQLQDGVFGSPTSLWLLDYANNQIDVFDVAAWPPTGLVTILAAVGDDSYSVSQLLTCDGMVLALRTGTPLLEAYDPTTYKFVNEVSLASSAGFQSLAVAACDGQHTVYVTDSANNTVTAVDLSDFKIAAQTTLPAADQLPPLSDGGTVIPSLWGVAVAAQPSGGDTLLVSLQNLDDSYTAAVAPSTVFELDPALTTWSSPIDPGAQCLDAFQIMVSPDQSTGYLACAGSFDSAGATSVQPYNSAGYLGVVAPASQAAKSPVTTTLSNPTSLAFLKNGLLAIGDYSPQSQVAFYNPVDAGISYVNVDCPLQPDGGLNPQQGVVSVIAAP